jgi:hypothetical protein
MFKDNGKEMDAIASFFHKRRGSQLNISISFFEGYLQRERMSVAPENLNTPHYQIRLLSLDSQRELEIDLNHYSFGSISPDQTEIEITRLLGGSRNFRLTASEIK